ncbi:MAG: DUF86 domain-containing protein [Methanocalculus sp.]|uniref:type VII toxin-antitoxin system HepT family RNase toxin n=1 Tax=Methanocalculus sp. TaxID=2004547 RepID=UPI0027200E43|nr:HepT-like ribonuclease domain-containing protein [Methanocalculus sp.]MDO8886441.1 DUF86 domain-containing protein [Candidatus Oleimmundimicrobium sp.]MDO9538695.1 DUF86 domain-containing protein [Methanocalculus sp.]
MRIYHHIDEFQNALADWKRYRSISEDMVVSDRDTRNMVLHAMMISIQSSIDIAADIIADGKLEKPGSYREAFEILGRHAIISERSVQDLSDLAGFRNILVHRYGDLDRGQVYAVLQQDYVVLEVYLSSIQQYLRKKE